MPVLLIYLGIVPVVALSVFVLRKDGGKLRDIFLKWSLSFRSSKLFLSFQRNPRLSNKNYSLGRLLSLLFSKFRILGRLCCALWDRNLC